MHKYPIESSPEEKIKSEADVAKESVIRTIEIIKEVVNRGDVLPSGVKVMLAEEKKSTRREPGEDWVEHSWYSNDVVSFYDGKSIWEIGHNSIRRDDEKEKVFITLIDVGVREVWSGHPGVFDYENRGHRDRNGVLVDTDAKTGEAQYSKIGIGTVGYDEPIEHDQNYAADKHFVELVNKFGEKFHELSMLAQ